MATASIRQQFQATSTKELKKIVQEEDVKIASKKNTDTYAYVDGVNKMRLYPKHKGESSFYHIMARHWITVENDKGEAGRRVVNNAKIHGNLAKDIVDEYIIFTKTYLAENDDADSSSKLKNLTSFEKGMNMQTSWVAYANHMDKGGKTFTLLEFKRGVRDAINENSIIEDEAEAIETDPFTDVDTGKPLLITYNSKAKKAADYYKVTISKNAVALTDEELEKFAKVTPLSQLPMLTYNMEHFELALEGLKYFDEAEEVGSFETDDFQAIVEELREMVVEMSKTSKKTGDTPSKNAAAPVSKKAVGKKVVEEADELEDDEAEEEDNELEQETAEETAETDPYDEMDRKELKAFISANSLEIKVFTSTTDDDLRTKIRDLMVVADEEEDEEVDKEVEEVEEEETPPPAKKVISKTTKPAVTEAKAGNMTLDQIKAKLRDGQKK